jgi:ubiquinone/menaquinone biosynthesis C-methylase UbiE
MDTEARVEAWDESYMRRENNVFSPSEEVVRFVARHLRRRIGLDEIVDVLPGAAGMRMLDVGCGIGRHLIYGQQMGLRMYGMDLSSEAVQVARQWLQRIQVEDVEHRAVVGDVRTLPWPDHYFDHALSDGVLDSMAFEIACAGVADLTRVLRPAGLFYCSLISGDQTGLEPGFAGERVVHDQHERGTVQSYFDEGKIVRMLDESFAIESIELVRHDDLTRQRHHGRWHVVARRR